MNEGDLQKSLIAEDSMAARRRLATFLLEVGTCDGGVKMGRTLLMQFYKRLKRVSPMISSASIS